MNNKRRLFINSVIVITSTLLDKGLFFIVNVIVARHLDVETFGKYTTALAYATFFSTFSDIGINQSLKRAINLESESENEHITNALLIKTALCIAVYIVLSISLFFTNYTRETIYLTLLFGIVRIGTTYMALFYANYDARERFFTEALMKNSYSILFVSVTAGVAILNLDYFFFAYSRLAIVAAFVIFFLILLKKQFEFKFKWPAMKKFLSETVFFGLSKIIRSAYLRINILLLSFIQGTIYTGIFQNAFYFFSSLSFLPINFGRVFLPRLYKTDFNTRKKEFQFAFDVYTKILAVMSIFITTIFYLFSRDIILLIYGEKYLASADVLQIVAFAIPFMFNVSGTIITSLDLQRYRTRVQAIALIINIISNLIFINLFKTEGAAITVVITYAFLFFSYNIFLNRKKGIIMKKVLLNYFRLIFISIFTCLIYHYSLDGLNHIVSFCAAASIYLALTAMLLIREDDIRIIREIFQGKKQAKITGTDKEIQS